MINFNQLTKKLNEEIQLIDGVYASTLYLQINFFDDDYKFPKKINSLLENTPKLCYNWRYNKLEKHVFGSIEIYYTEIMISQKKELIKSFPCFNINFLKKEGTFLFASLGYMHYVILEVENLDYKLWLMLPNGSYYLMDITIEKYIGFILLTKGMYLAEAYLCPNFPKKILLQNYSKFYDDMKLLFNINLNDLPMCYHKEIIKDSRLNNKNYDNKSMFEEFKKLFKAEIKEEKCKLIPSLDSSKTERIKQLWYLDAIELNTGTVLPVSYKQLMFDLGKESINFTRTTKDKRFISIKFLNCFTDVFKNSKTNKFDLDANIYLYGEKDKVPAFNGIRLFAISQEYKFGMHILEEDNIEIVMVDSVENMRLVQMPEHIRTMDGFMKRFLETKGEFLLDEIPL